MSDESMMNDQAAIAQLPSILPAAPPKTPTATAHNNDSSTREKVIEHLILGELLRCLWIQGRRDIEVLRGEVDKGGYDLVVECGGVMRHIQLKSSHRQAATFYQKVNINLARRPSGCVIWVFFDANTLELGPFLWFGGRPGEPLPPLGDRMGKHTKGNREGLKTARPNIRVLPRGEFLTLSTMHEVGKTLFGDGSSER